MLKDRHPCPYEKALLSTDFKCHLAQRGQLGERAMVDCESETACSECNTYLGQLRQRARFALKVVNPEQPLAFGKERKIIYGGLNGLQQVMDLQARDDVADIHTLINNAKDRYGSLQSLPFQEIIKSVSHYQARSRRSRK